MGCIGHKEPEIDSILDSILDEGHVDVAPELVHEDIHVESWVLQLPELDELVHDLLEDILVDVASLCECIEPWLGHSLAFSLVGENHHC